MSLYLSLSVLFTLHLNPYRGVSLSERRGLCWCEWHLWMSNRLHWTLLSVWYVLTANKYRISFFKEFQRRYQIIGMRCTFLYAVNAYKCIVDGAYKCSWWKSTKSYFIYWPTEKTVSNWRVRAIFYSNKSTKSVWQTQDTCRIDHQRKLYPSKKCGQPCFQQSIPKVVVLHTYLYNN